MADVQQANATIAAHALAKHVRMSPQKARLVIDLIRGRKVQDALQTLQFTPKRAARPKTAQPRSQRPSPGFQRAVRPHPP